MKKSKILVLAISAFAFISLTGCDKDVETSPLSVDLSPKATITGFVAADLNLSTFDNEPAPAGTKVIVSTTYAELGLSATGTWSDTVFIDSEGKFVAKVPADQNSASYSILPIDFTFDQVQGLNSNYTTIKKFYSASAINVSVKAGDNQITAITYNAPQPLPAFVEMVKITGTFEGEFDASVAGLESVPANTSITFYTDGWNKTITIGNAGAYSIEVPKGEAIKFSYDFTTAKKVSEGAGYVSKNYRIKATGVAFGTRTQNENEVDFVVVNGTAL